MTDYALKETSGSYNLYNNSNYMSLINRQWKRWGITYMLMLAGTTASAAAFEFNGGAVEGCTLTALTYNCASSPSTSADTIKINRKYSIIGNLSGASAVLSNDVILTGSLNVVGAVTLGVGAKVSGNLTSTSGTVTMAERASVDGNLYAGETVTMAANASVVGNLTALTTVTMAANASVGGNVTAGETVTMAAGVHVDGNVKGTTVSLAAKGVVKGSVSGTTVSLAEGASIGGSVLEATTVSLAANATVFGDVNATGTVSLAERGCVRGNVWAATTVSLAANATIAGSVVAGTTFSLAHNASVGGSVTVTGALLPPGIDTNGLGGSANCPANSEPGAPITTITTTTTTTPTTPGGGTPTTTTPTIELCIAGINCGCIEVPGASCKPCVVGTGDPHCTLIITSRRTSWRQLK